MVEDPSRSARAAGLTYASDRRPGITRRRDGDGFTYLDPEGREVDDPDALERIRGLAIPPAWEDVWIAPEAGGHLQAVGRDAKGRKQYRYHPGFRQVREREKFAALIAFGEALPRIRERLEADLARPGLPREKVLALVVRLLETTLIRVGNEEYARLNRSFGLTTLRDRHARVEGSRVRFSFKGKSGKVHDVGLRDRRLAALVRRCQGLPGQDLFQYLDAEGVVRDVTSGDVNAYLKEASGLDVTAKTFRTWAATVLAVRALREGATVEALRSARGAKRGVVTAMREIADRLGNTPTVARASYVHPAVVDAYLEGTIGEALVEAAEEESAPPALPTEDEEAETLRLLRESLSRGRPRRRRTKSDPTARPQARCNARDGATRTRERTGA